jgi:hypothetical protein
MSYERVADVIFSWQYWLVRSSRSSASSLNTKTNKFTELSGVNKTMTKSVLLFFLAIAGVSGWGLHDERRSFVTAVAQAGMAFVAVATPSDANAILSSKYCAAGVGDGCDDRSEGNEYIKALQEKSALNREANLKVSPPVR